MDFPDHVAVKFLPGAKVRIESITGHVSAIMVSWPMKRRYEVTYWNAGERKEVWVDEFELEKA